MFDWEDLRYFIVFAHERSLSGAARALKVDHATVARRISALESSLNLKLVDRRPRAYVITEDGERIAQLGRRMENESFAVQRTALAGQDNYVGEVTVSAPPALACALIAPHLNELRANYPQLSLQLIGSLGSASLSRREADIAVRLSRPKEPDLVARKVATIPFYLYASADYLAATAAQDLVFIAYDETMEQSPQQAWLKQQAGDRSILLRSNDLNIQATAAQAGAGVAALPGFLGERYGLQTMPSVGAGLTRDVWLVVHNDIRHTPAVQAVMGFLVSCFDKPARA
ncbi:LysR family transcriptional regulator [Pseudomonas nunensis]|uniref:LysR family transcriptional regulator n=1 Tax=Pseudomonas nunensis TaxID=2961896 RepID=A0ABY5EQA2_9PSED|nr:LysR family transcriptional regulator [Pseudomonas nunensis]KPN90610.1 LysR family transcriptional regulator [Pseudomonas nunensis]MCL5225373.1 LysR family transcriptional regulator [Pseudomonas nunensis]UTO16865.1 LysR family transcriptional regulator [Pseudomonas nunensis]